MMISHYPTRGRRRLGLLSLAVLATASMIGLAGLLPATASTVAAAEAAPVQSAREDASSRQQLPPRYPPNAVLNREEGQVVLTVSVSVDGTPTAMEVDPEYTDAPASLQQAAMAAVAQWTFQPAEEDGMAIAGKVRVPITFSISDEDEDDDDTR
jgi:protein TonB